MGPEAKQILIAGATAAVTTTVAVLLTHWLTKQSTTQDIASGKTPLPPGSTPTTDGPPIVAKPAPNPPPQKPPTYQTLNQYAQQAQQGADVPMFNASVPTVQAPKCPPGYHSVATGQPNFPYMCVADS